MAPRGNQVKACTYCWRIAKSNQNTPAPHPAFDSLTTSAKLATLRQVAEHLLEETPETLELTAVSESTVYAIFQTLLSVIEMEIDIADEIGSEMLEEDRNVWCYWRSLALQAWDEASKIDGDDDDDGTFFPEDERCTHLEHWEYLTESLADCILWDRDFEMNSLFLDVAPELAQTKKQFLGIENDYYSAAAPDVKQDQVVTTLESLRDLLRKPR